MAASTTMQKVMPLSVSGASSMRQNNTNVESVIKNSGDTNIVATEAITTQRTTLSRTILMKFGVRHVRERVAGSGARHVWGLLPILTLTNSSSQSQINQRARKASEGDKIYYYGYKKSGNQKVFLPEVLVDPNE